MQAAMRGAFWGILVVKAVGFIARHFVLITQFLVYGGIAVFLMRPLINVDANDSEMIDIIRYVSSERYTVNGSTITMYYDNQSRYKITKGIVKCNGKPISSVDITIAPHTVEQQILESKYADVFTPESCQLSFKPVEVVQFRHFRTLYSYDQMSKAED
jgi:hypothetical protein